MRITAILEELRALTEASKFKRGTPEEQRRRREVAKHSAAAKEDRPVKSGLAKDPRKVGKQPTKGRFDLYYVVLRKRVLRFSRANWEESVKRTLAAGAQRLYGGKDLKGSNSQPALAVLMQRNPPQDRIYKDTAKWSMARWKKEAKALGILPSQMTPELVSDRARAFSRKLGSVATKVRMAKVERGIAAAETEAAQERGAKPKRRLSKKTDKSWPLGGARFVYGKVVDPVVIKGVAYYTGKQLINKFGFSRYEVTKFGRDKRTTRKRFRSDGVSIMVVLVPVEMIERKPKVSASGDEFPTADGIPVKRARMRRKRGAGQRGKRRNR